MARVEFSVHTELSRAKLTRPWIIYCFTVLCSTGGLETTLSRGLRPDLISCKPSPTISQLLPQAVPAAALPVPHGFDGRYSNVENRSVSPPDRLWSRIRRDRDTRGESCRSVALRRGAKAARKEPS